MRSCLLSCSRCRPGRWRRRICCDRARERGVHVGLRRSGARRGDADEVVEALEPLLVSLSGGLVAEQLLRHEKRGVWRGVGPPRARAARALHWVRRLRVLLMLGVVLRCLRVRARRDMLLVAGSAPPCAGGRGTWRRAYSPGARRLTRAARVARVFTMARRRTRRLLTRLKPPTWRARCRVMTPKNRG